MRDLPPAGQASLVKALGARMKNLVTAALCVILLAACNVSFSPGATSDLPEPTPVTSEQQQHAAKAARRYLKMIDRRDFDATWKHSGPALRAQTNEVAWKATLKLTTRVLGGSPQRELEGFGFSSRIDASVPQGEYVLVQFKNVSGAVTTTEKVVMQMDQAEWKIIGYFITKRADFVARSQ
jgi:hypothetical protein